ncbi:MAG: hypothetical protein KGJ86_03905 [Chloroflexota bacterium]|nr:hypothetical protein [Chloroflexota bacterium]
MKTNTPRFGFVLEPVDDLQAAKQFYVDVMGLKVEREHPVFVQFANFAIAGDGTLSGTREKELYWLVDDAHAAYEELSEQAEITMPLTLQPYGRVFGLKDSAGHVQYVLELAKDRPSASV